MYISKLFTQCNHQTHCYQVTPQIDINHDECVKGNNFEELMTVRDGGERVNVLIREHKGFIEDILVIVNGSNDEFVFVNIIGKFMMDDTNKIMKDVDFNTELSALWCNAL